MEMPATRKIGIPALKPAAKATLGFVLLEDEVCGTVAPPVEVVVELVVEEVVHVVVKAVVEAVVEVVVKAVEEAETTREVVMLGIKVATCAGVEVGVLVAASIVV